MPVERFGASVTPRPDTAQDLIDQFGITAEQADDGSPDLVGTTWQYHGTAPHRVRAKPSSRADG